MHDGLRKVERKLIPRWRPIATTPSVELGGGAGRDVKAIDANEETSEVLREFSNTPSVQYAIEALYLHRFVRDKTLLIPAANLVLGTKGLFRSVYQLAEDIIGNSKPPQKPQDKPKRLIAHYRRAILQNPRNALAHVELARSFASIGVSDKAESHFRIALALAPNNRFVLRAAGRFFVHLGNEERAFKAMKDAARYDPWVAASRMSIAHLGKLPMPRSREIEALIERVADPRQTSELSAALATAELGAGNLKKAKKLFRASSVAPTDNVVAQLEWVANEHGFSFDESLLRNDLTYEARTARHIRDQEWRRAVENCDLWLDDEPFSLRPAYEASFIAAELLLDYGQAQQFIMRGLTANPNDVVLLNNLAFFEIMQGGYAEGQRLLLQARKCQPNDDSLIAIEATEGLLLYRTGQPDAGSLLYEKSILRAKKAGDRRSVQLAFMHLAIEEIKRGVFFPDSDVKKIVDMYTSKRADPQIAAIFRAQLEPLLFFGRDAAVLTPARSARETLASIDADAKPVVATPVVAKPVVLKKATPEDFRM